MVDLVDRAQELEEILREEALRRVLDRVPRPSSQETDPPSIQPAETDET